MTKILFHIINFISILLYIYPGSILGFLVYGDISKQPQITTDFYVSSNHVYAFIVISILGFISYFKKLKFIVLYIINISIFLELFHLIIPNRSFQFSDLFGNMIGVLISIILLILFIYWRKK